MTTSLKKLLLISATLLLGVMSGGAMAITITVVSTNPSSYSGNSISAVTSSDGSFVNNMPLIGSQPWFGNSVTAENYATNAGHWTASGKSYSPLFIYGYNSVDERYQGFTWTSEGAINFNGPTVAFNTSTVFATVGGAPEIDGSLAPKIALLLGCSYLMFGGKKQNSEPMMTA